METPRKYLFVCIANVNRSKTGERVFRELAGERGYSLGVIGDSEARDFYVSSCGTSVDHFRSLSESNALGLAESLQYSEELGELADVIFAADKYVVRELWDVFEAPMKKVVDLEIPDNYNIRLPDDRFALENLMRIKLEEYLPR